MKYPLLFLLALAATVSAAISPEEAANTIILDENGVKNLRIETVEAEETTFPETVFALGRINVAPGRRAVVSSRVPGRVASVETHIDTTIAKDAVAVVLESRLPGDPPPMVKLLAPLGGLVSVVKVTPGQPVEPSDSLLEIIDLTAVHATAAVPLHLTGKLQPGQQASIRVLAYPEDEFVATLAHLGAEADPASGTLEAAFHVDNPGTLLRPGMRAEFSIVVNQREGVMSLPRLALQGDATSRVVYRKHYDTALKHTFVRVPVQVGAMNERTVEITAGLVAGDEVVTTGAYSLGFAGKGSVSLKEALDAAHGHEHNEDGSEMTAGQKTSQPKSGNGHDHDDAHFSTLTLFSLASNALLLVLLAVAMRRAKMDRKPEGVQS